MKRSLLFGLVLSLAACEEPPVRELELPSNDKTAVFTRDLESWHILSGTYTKAARKINIAASARTNTLRLK